MTGFQGGPHITSGGRQHFEALSGIAYQWHPHLKVDMNRPKEGMTSEFPPGNIK